MSVKKICENIIYDDSRYVVLLCQKGSFLQKYAAVKSLRISDSKNGKYYFFNNEKGFEFSLIDTCVGEYDQMLINSDEGYEAFNIIDMSQDLLTGAYKLVAIEEDSVVEGLHPWADNSEFYKEINALQLVLQVLSKEDMAEIENQNEAA